MILALLLLMQAPPLEPPLSQPNMQGVAYQRTYDDLCMMAPHACVGIQPGFLARTEPRIGTPFKFAVASNCGGPADSPYLLIRSRRIDTWAGQALPMTLELLGSPECYRYVGSGVNTVRQRSQTETINIPNVAELIGQVFYFQAFFHINDWTAAPNNANPHMFPWWYVMPEVRWASTKLMVVTVL